MFLFEAQTGRLSRSFRSSRELDSHNWPSNYYHYLLYDKYRGWVQLAVNKAEATDCGLSYPDQHQFLEKLADRDARDTAQRREVRDW